jgi:cytochrome c5
VSHTDSSLLKTMVMIIGALVVFMILIIIAANWLSKSSTNVHDDPMVQEAIEKRIAPVGQVNTGAVAPAAAAAGPVDGKATFEQACFACHGTGAAGAPKFGDKGAWGPRIGQGMDTLFTHALNGFKGMPPRGGRADLDDDSVKAAVKYMVEHSK